MFVNLPVYMEIVINTGFIQFVNEVTKKKEAKEKKNEKNNVKIPYLHLLISFIISMIIIAIGTIIAKV